MPHRLTENYQHFEGTCSLHPQDYSSTLKMGTVDLPKHWYLSTWLHNITSLKTIPFKFSVWKIFEGASQSDIELHDDVIITMFYILVSTITIPDISLNSSSIGLSDQMLPMWEPQISFFIDFFIVSLNYHSKWTIWNQCLLKFKCYMSSWVFRRDIGSVPPPTLKMGNVNTKIHRYHKLLRTPYFSIILCIRQCFIMFPSTQFVVQIYHTFFPYYMFWQDGAFLTYIRTQIT
jgi:hypothetical protein